MKSPSTSPQYERFGETIRYLTVEELQQFFDAIEDYRHKLMMRVIYELGCRVGEFVRIQLRHIAFDRSTVYFPAENTKTRQRRVSHPPVGLMNELRSLLRMEGRMARRTASVRHPAEYLFQPPGRPAGRYTENRLRQLFMRYVRAAGISREYGRDTRGRVLHELTIHSLRHSHIMHYVHVYKLPLPIVQRQVGHKTLKATSVYLRPSDEAVGHAHADVRRYPPRMTKPPQGFYTELSSLRNDTQKTPLRTHTNAAGAHPGNRRVDPPDGRRDPRPTE
ncbi:MAG: site-specific integrase [Phycisphaerales bacterium]|nr:site-specific integrase [Phycisphaerales bacterium]